MSNSPKKSSEAEEFLEFLNSLPEDDRKKSVSGSNGKTDEEILEFLDELEANNGANTTKKEELKPVKESSVKPVAEEQLKDDKEDVHEEIPLSPESATKEVGTDPLASISSWWSSEGSSRVTSLWGSAQLKAEELIKLAKEKGLDQEHLRKAFNDIVIKEEGDDTDEQDEIKLPDAGKAIESLNKGIGMFSSRLGSVIDKLNTDLVEFSSTEHDEILNIQLIHDLKNYHYVNNLIGSNFKKVMNAQVDGDLLIKVTDNHISNKNDDEYKRNLNVFHGKIGDCEKLILANLEESIKSATLVDKQTNIFIGLHPVTVQSTITDSTSTDEINIDLYNPGNFSFIIMLKDITHDLTIVTKTQPFPMKWANWVDGSEEPKETSSTDVDPSQWVKGWIKDGLDLGFGVLLQSYVIKRMGF